ncbi:hypothetical protein V6N00_13930 [Tersicoccus sp. MR15.9]|uniref:hypothetical protein n=1 Tax=Tersicoccus mangrovi TaxID=3121635 RepID=UPI002FE5C9EE
MSAADLHIALLDETVGMNGNGRIAVAAHHAAFLHRNQTRANRGTLDRTPYVEHPLRNALRLVRWGVRDVEVIIAAILHDVVEDCAPHIAAHFLGHSPTTVPHHQLRAAALGWIADVHGVQVASLVEAVSMPALPRDITPEWRRLLYAAHVDEAVSGNAAVLLLKFSDYVDNALGLHHNNVPANRRMVTKLARKYLPLSGTFVREITTNRDLAGMVSEHGYAEITRQALAAEPRLRALLEQLAAA